MKRNDISLWTIYTIKTTAPKERWTKDQLAIKGIDDLELVENKNGDIYI